MSTSNQEEPELDMKKDIEKEKLGAKERKDNFFNLVRNTEMTRKIWINYLQAEILDTEEEMEEDKDSQEI